MTALEMHDRYFEWMCNLVMGSHRYSKRLSYKKLMRRLNQREFRWVIPMDENRAARGINLRYRFGEDCGYSQREIASLLDDHECSVLEMMVALCLACEEKIMDDPAYGDRTGQWFWNMIVSLGLGSMSDSRYHEREVDDILNRFMDRQYAPNGQGGLFTIEGCPYDLRGVDIWYQLQWYLNSIM